MKNILSNTTIIKHAIGRLLFSTLLCFAVYYAARTLWVGVPVMIYFLLLSLGIYGSALIKSHPASLRGIYYIASGLHAYIFISFFIGYIRGHFHPNYVYFSLIFAIYIFSLVEDALKMNQSTAHPTNGIK